MRCAWKRTSSASIPSGPRPAPAISRGRPSSGSRGGRWPTTEGSINGERFQTVYLPELQILSTPRLTFEGTPEKLAVRGEVRLPELLISGPPTRAVVLPSRDVILEGAPKPAEKTFPLALDVQVRLTIGEKVLVKAEGIDAQLGGSIDLMLQSLDKITSKGEIRVVKGRYRAFGADLEIVRGRLFYAGGPINQPTLDILALRTVGDVRAGITAGGLLRAPVIKLYSEPAMPDVDILAYILFGHPLGTSSSLEQAGMMAQVASSLLSRGQSVALQEQIKNRLGLSTLEIQSGEASGPYGVQADPGNAPRHRPGKAGGQRLPDDADRGEISDAPALFQLRAVALHRRQPVSPPLRYLQAVADRNADGERERRGSLLQDRVQLKKGGIESI